MRLPTIIQEKNLGHSTSAGRIGIDIVSIILSIMIYHDPTSYEL